MMDMNETTDDERSQKPVVIRGEPPRGIDRLRPKDGIQRGSQIHFSEKSHGVNERLGSEITRVKEHDAASG